MNRYPPRIRRALLARSFLVQGSWNFETLIGTGFAFVLLPALRHTFRAEDGSLNQALARHAELFNSHPYLATLAVGAVAELEADGSDPTITRRFKAALRGSLGSIGDQLIWLAWRPAVALLGVVLLLAGAPWWVAVSAFLVTYNALHLWLRVWGLHTGLEAGLRVGAALREAPFQAWGHRVADAGALLGGFGFALAIGNIPGGAGDSAIAAAAALAGLAFGLRVRLALWIALTGVWAAGLLFGFAAS